VVAAREIIEVQKGGYLTPNRTLQLGQGGKRDDNSPSGSKTAGDGRKEKRPIMVKRQKRKKKVRCNNAGKENKKRRRVFGA